jgi:hypothetical protein
MYLYSRIKTLLGIQPKQLQLFPRGLRGEPVEIPGVELKYVDIQPLSGLIVAEGLGRQTYAVMTITSHQDASSKTDWVLMPYELWGDSAKSVEQDVKLPADDRTSYGGTSDD